jgi:hypothetical protein
MALWALMHVCDINPGGVAEPIHIAVLRMEGGKPVARLLDDSELQEQRNMVLQATEHLASFRDILEGKKFTSAVPVPGA